MLKKHDIHALNRAIQLQEKWRDEHHEAGDYDAQFFEADAESLKRIKQFVEANTTQEE